MVSFSVNGAMGDNFFLVTRNLSIENEVYVLTNKDVNSDLLKTSDICNIRFNRKKIFDFINPASYFKIYKYVKSHEFDVCFICSFHPVNMYIYRIIDNRKIVIFIHDHILHSGVGLLDRFLIKKQLTDYYNRSAQIIVSCNFIKEDILKYGLLRDKSKIAVNYLGLLENLSYPRIHVNPDIDVLFFGRIEFYKGLDVLVEVGKQMLNTKFVVVGKGNLKNIYGIQHLPSNFEHINRYVPDEELAMFIQRSKLVVLPYRDATGTQTVQSVFYYKKPVVATNVGCFPEYIINGMDGLIVPALNCMALREALEKLLNDEELRKTMGQNGFQRLSREFSNAEITRRYVSIFSLICNK